MRVAPVVVVAFGTLVLAGAAFSASDPKQPQQRHTAADTTLARSVALRRADFAPGWTAQTKQPPTPPCPAEPNESRLVETARIDPTFVWRDTVTTVGSEIDVFKTAAQARLDWRLTTLHLLEVCLLVDARRSLGHGVRVSLRSVSVLPAPTHVERALHYRLVFDLKGKRDVSVVTEIVGVGIGRVSVLLHAFTVARPLPTSALDTLTAVLAQRLVGASPGI